MRRDRDRETESEHRLLERGKTMIVHVSRIDEDQRWIMFPTCPYKIVFIVGLYLNYLYLIRFCC